MGETESKPKYYSGDIGFSSNSTLTQKEKESIIIEAKKISQLEVDRLNREQPFNDFYDGFKKGFNTVPTLVLDSSKDVLTNTIKTTSEVISEATGSIIYNPLFLISGGIFSSILNKKIKN